MDLNEIIVRYNVDGKQVYDLIDKMCTMDSNHVLGIELSRSFYTDIIIFLIMAFNEGNTAGLFGEILLELMRSLGVYYDFIDIIKKSKNNK